VGVAAAGDRVCLSDGGAGVHLFDGAVSGSPRLLGSYDTSGRADRAVVAGDRVFVVDNQYSQRRLVILDASDPAAIVELGRSQPMPATSRSWAIWRTSPAARRACGSSTCPIRRRPTRWAPMPQRTRHTALPSTELGRTSRTGARPDAPNHRRVEPGSACRTGLIPDRGHGH